MTRGIPDYPQEELVNRLKRLLQDPANRDRYIPAYRLVEQLTGVSGLRATSKAVEQFNKNGRLRDGWISLLEPDFEVDSKHMPEAGRPRTGRSCMHYKFSKPTKQRIKLETESQSSDRHDETALRTFIPDYQPRHLSEAERYRLKAKRENIMHVGRLQLGDRVTTIQVSDRVVKEAEWGIDDPNAVVWAKKPNARNHWVHHVTTQRSRVAVLERRSPKGKLIEMFTQGGKNTLMDPNGAILKCAILRGIFEFTYRPTQDQPNPTKVRKLTEQERKKANDEPKVPPTPKPTPRPPEELPRYGQGHIVIKYPNGVKMEIDGDQGVLSQVTHDLMASQNLGPKEAAADGRDRIKTDKVVEGFLELEKQLTAVPYPLLIIRGADLDPPLRITDPAYRLYRNAFYKNQSWIAQLAKRHIQLDSDRRVYDGPLLPKGRYKHYWVKR